MPEAATMRHQSPDNGGQFTPVVFGHGAVAAVPAPGAALHIFGASLPLSVFAPGFASVAPAWSAGLAGRKAGVAPAPGSGRIISGTAGNLLVNDFGSLVPFGSHPPLAPLVTAMLMVLSRLVGTEGQPSKRVISRPEVAAGTPAVILAALIALGGEADRSQWAPLTGCAVPARACGPEQRAEAAAWVLPGGGAAL